MKNILLTLMVFGLVGCSSTTFNPSADHWVSMPSTSLCFTYYSNYGVARDKTWRLTNYNRIINEIDRRGISCKTFAKASDKDWMRDWVNKISNQYSVEKSTVMQPSYQNLYEIEKQQILVKLTQRCKSYGFTGEANISVCVQREAQNDKYEAELKAREAQVNAGSRAAPVPKEEKVPWLIKFLGDVAMGVAEGYEHQQTHPTQTPAPKNDVHKNCRPNC